jgi:predicted nicotinamide N-methyase
VPEIALHLTADVAGLWSRLAEDRVEPEDCFPYWSVAWVGGQALARYLLDNPEEVAGKIVFDLGAGSGICAIAARRAGATQVRATDIDPFSREAIALNAELNDVDILVCASGLLVAGPPPAEVVLAGDVCYERDMSARVLPWLRGAHARGIRVLLGDPGREYFPRSDTIRLADYEIPTAEDVEGVKSKRASVYTFT